METCPGDSRTALSLSGMSAFWDRLAGVQPVPAAWVVAASGAIALLVVLDGRAWHLARNTITIAHEGGHALVSLLSGRRLDGIRLHSDTSGVTMTRGRRTGPGAVLTAAAGYLTPPLLGAGAAWLLAAHHVTATLWLLLVLLAATFLAVRNAFGVFAVLATAAAVWAVTWFASAAVQAVFGYGVAWFLLFGGVRPVIELQRQRRRGRTVNSDADQLARMTRMAAGLWVTLFLVVAMAALLVGARLLIPGSLHVPESLRLSGR
jgi:Peptidase M50B-like